MMILRYKNFISILMNRGSTDIKTDLDEIKFIVICRYFCSDTLRKPDGFRASLCRCKLMFSVPGA